MKEYRNEDGERHRINGPAVEWDDGVYTWWYDGEVHRYYGIAMGWFSVYEYWIFNERVK